MPPRVKITQEELLKLIGKNYSPSEIASHFQVSKATVSRHIRLLNISLKGKKSKAGPSYNNAAAEGGTKDEREMAETPKSSRSPYVRQRNNVKGAFLLNKLSGTEGKDENVLAPLSLFHTGGFYKLAHWGYVIHGCIDVYSRYITYLGISNNNTASQVLRLFQSGVAELGLPARVRCDHGMENVGVAHFMAINRPQVSDRIMLQSSATNSRLRRFWYGVGRSVQPFFDIFSDLEESGDLDTESDIDLYCLHQCFTRLLEAHMNETRTNWNNHRMISVGESTPRQLTLVGLMSLKLRSEADKSVYYSELDQPSISFVEEKEWAPTEDMNETNVDIQELKQLLKTDEEEEMCNIFRIDCVTLEAGAQVYLLVKKYVQSVLGSD